MEKKDIVTRVTNVQTKNDLLLLLNDLLREELGDSCKYEFSVRQLGFFSNPNKDGRYHNFFISKKSGGNRTISAPIYKMGRMLHYVNSIFKALYTPSEYAMGYCEGRNVVDNAVRHLGQNYIFNTDLEDLFPSIHQFRVQRRLKAAPFNFNDSISRVLAGLCCLRKEKPNGGYEYVLPQGAPTSPILANAVCDDLDRKLAGLSRRFGLHYTRYADDITFSSMHNVYQQDGEFLKEFEKIVKGQGFKINREKTRLQKMGQHQEVTGLTVSSRVNTAREYVAEIRNILHIWERYGFEDAYASFYRHYVCSKGHIKKRIPLLENVLFGKLQYLKMVKGEKDPVYSALRARYNNLASPWNYDGNKKLEYLYSFPVWRFEKMMGSKIYYSFDGNNFRYAEFFVEKEGAGENVSMRVVLSQRVKEQLSKWDADGLYVVLVSEGGRAPFWMMTIGNPLGHQNLDNEYVSSLLDIWQKEGIEAAIKEYEKNSRNNPKPISKKDKYVMYDLHTGIEGIV